MERPERYSRGLRNLASLSFILSVSAFARTDASDVDAELIFNQKFLGLISSALDEDVVAFEDVAGSKVTVRVTRANGNSLKPDVDLLDANFAVLDTGVVKQKTAESASIVGYPLPATGKYHVRVRSGNGLTGTYSLSLKGKPPKKPQLPAGAIAAPGEIDGLFFAARGQSKLSGSIARAGGDLVPLAVELVSPSGVLVPLPPGKTQLDAESGVLELKNVSLPALGTYQLRITGQGGTTGGYQPKLKIAAPQPIVEAVYENEHPTPAGGEQNITLREVFFGRGLRTAGGGIGVVSPFSFVRTDPVSNLPIPGSLEPMFPGVDLSKAVPFELDSYYAPMIVPRNAVLVLRFDRAPDQASLRLSDEGLSTSDTPIEVVVNGEEVVFEAIVQGNDVIVNPVVANAVGFPGSPVAVDSSGNAVASPIGVGSITIAGGPTGLAAKGGGQYQPRGDLLGSPDAGGSPIGFNPGNTVLDFFDQSTVSGAAISFEGFLPDDTPPRIVREQKFARNYAPNFAAPTLGDSQGLDEVSIVVDFALDSSQNGGKGEYAGGVFRLRPLGPFREDRVIERHSTIPLSDGLYRHTFELASKIAVPLKAPDGFAPGDAYEVARAEYYEPDPENPIDPDAFDPLDPDLFENMQIANFIEARDRDGKLQDVSQSIDPLSTLTVRFDEPMLLESFRPHESFFVAEDAGSGHPPALDDGRGVLGRVTAAEGGKALTFAPHREVQFGPGAGTIEPVGFGPFPRAWNLHLTSVPTSGELISLLGEQGAAEFFATGRTGVTDLGGRPLALGIGAYTAAQPFADLRFPFTTKPDASLAAIGVVVHRFLGSPHTAVDPAGGTGVTFHDIPESLCGPLGNVYGPRIADVNIAANGFLSGAPVEFIQKIHDDFHPPPSGPFSAFAFGTSTPIGGFSVLGGARMQHVYRAVDCSPDHEALGGTLLDLLGVRYAPLGGVVANTILPDVSIHAGHSAVVPDTAQAGGIPEFAQSGLGGPPPAQYVFGGHFATLGDPSTDYVPGSYNATVKETGEALRRQLVFGSLQPDQVADFHAGNPLVIDSSQVSTLPGSPLRKYHPLPVGGFDVPFVYDNGGEDGTNYPLDDKLTFGIPGKPRHHSLVLEYRVRVHPELQTAPSTQNVFTFAFGILSSALPRFRIFTFGAGCTACCTPGNQCGNTCSVSTGPIFNGTATGGGDPLEPDRIVHAIGPNVSAPGLQCYCVGTAQNHAQCPQGLTEQSDVDPTSHALAYGEATPPNQNNFGDNSRYFMVFDYVKRESYVRSPFVRAMPVSVTDPVWLEPIFSPPLTQQPAGTTVVARFRTSTDGFGGLSASPWVAPENLASVSGSGRKFVQFDLRIEGDTSTRLAPVFDEIAIPFRK